MKVGLRHQECKKLLVTPSNSSIQAKLKCEKLPRVLFSANLEGVILTEAQVQGMDQKDPLKKGMATHSSILAWRIPWTEKPGRLQSTGSQRVGHTEAT